MPLATHHDGGGTLHLPSPSHCHHIDPSAAIAQLRRSLSRSPSRRSQSPKIGSPKLGSPLSPSPSSPNLRSHSLAHSPLAIPYPPSARKARSGIRKCSPMRSAHLSTSNRKLVLEESNDQGNIQPSTSDIFSMGQENGVSTTPSGPPPYKTILVDSSVQPAALGDCDVQVPNQVFSRKDRHEMFTETPARSSPLKRSDRSNNSDRSQSGSPSAKRRSLHGASFGPDFNIFDQYTSSEAATGIIAPVQDSTTGRLESGSQSFSPVPKRSGSLRKATLQQRYEKPLRLRTSTEGNSDALAANPVRNRLRLSLDNYMQSNRESTTYTQPVPSTSASLHPAVAVRKATNNQPQRHPLSRTLTQSSSGSSFADDSPTHVPIRQPENRRPRLDFTKSLPLHAARPVENGSGVPSDASHDATFATPEHYKLAKPLPAAFMSTGLISKKNKNIDQQQLDARGSIGHMPDTPCKRPVSFASLSPSAGTALNQGCSRPNRHTMHSFGTPSTPFNHHVAGLDVGIGPRAEVFGRSFNGNAPRRGSFLADDIPNLPSASGHQSRRGNSRVEIPPTPTKQASIQPHAQSFSFRSQVGIDKDNEAKQGSCGASNDTGSFATSFFESSSEEESDIPSTWDEVRPPFTIQRQRSFSSNDLFGADIEAPQAQSPTPKTRNFNTVPKSRRKGHRNQGTHHNLASPHFSRNVKVSPKTPADMVPPDPSGLSISANTRSQSLFVEDLGIHAQSLPPVTPTANRDSFPRVSRHGATLTPMHHAPPAEIDESITSRFDKVELIGAGEFSSVFRVVRQLGPDSGSSRYFSRVNQGDVHKKPSSTTQTWAVKKTRSAYLGQRDRLRKLQEVEILRMLGRSEHTLQFEDSWEYSGHLYIQTEYCDEGSLDVFLDRVGRNARLDDFRIWKILLELTEGLQHVHDSGIIHLDLKPANVLINFEGVLKIADFGMATRWPAAPGIDGEGDREYIAPEILRGKFDKPADVFALGLIMLEIAGNVMLPENGVSWQRLRSGDMSDVPSLTSSSLSTCVSRDASGQPLPNAASPALLPGGSFSEDPIDALGLGSATCFTPWPALSTQHQGRAGELHDPPAFMKDAANQEALDALVRWMINPDPEQRPRAVELLSTTGVSWVKSRRRAGATVYEGNWGPADDVLQDDAEMIDV